MVGFKLRTSGAQNDCSTLCAVIPARNLRYFFVQGVVHLVENNFEGDSRPDLINIIAVPIFSTLEYQHFMFSNSHMTLSRMLKFQQRIN